MDIRFSASLIFKFLTSVYSHATLEIEREFGKEVLRLIESDSEDKREDLPPEQTWKIRKQETIDYLKNKADRKEKIIALSDKLSNIRSIYRDYEKIGNELWNRFNQTS